MADPLNTDVVMAIDGLSSYEFETSWFEVTLLVADEPSLDMSTLIFDNGMATPYFESLWNGVAAKLGKDDITTSVILENNGYPTAEFESYWSDLIT